MRHGERSENQIPPALPEPARGTDTQAAVLHPPHRRRGDGPGGPVRDWRDPDIDKDKDPAAWLITCTIITTEATDAAGRVHPPHTARPHPGPLRHLARPAPPEHRRPLRPAQPARRWPAQRPARLHGREQRPKPAGI